MHGTATTSIASSKQESVIHFRAILFIESIIRVDLIEELHLTLFVTPGFKTGLQARNDWIENEGLICHYPNKWNKLWPDFE